jgi:uncharacterized protein YecE (DUF72 family)
MARGEVRIGTSGWMYSDWAERVYPAKLPKRSWLAHYAGLFDTVELNSTFYRLPKPEAVARWAATVPDGFVFALKLVAFGSHRMKLRDPAGWLARHVETFSHLGATLGPTLVQLPPRWSVDVGRLEEFLATAPTTTQRWAVELRHPSWVRDDVFEVLQRHGAALCIHDLLPGLPWERTTSWTYLRFHGPNALEHKYVGRYTGRRLAAIARRLAPWVAEGTDVYGYFNNDYDAHAVADACWLRERLRPDAGGITGAA